MEATDRWDEYLVYEHELIERAMAALKLGLDGLEHGTYDAKQLARSVDFLLEFGDRLHNAKEEQLLFPRMAERGIAVEGGPLGVMIREHAEERSLLRAMLLAVPSLPTMSAEERIRLREEGYAYLAMRHEHIWKENDVLFAMGRKVLNQADNAELMAAFEKLNQETYGEQAEDHFMRMVEELEAGGQVRQRLVTNLSLEQIEGILEALPVEVTFVDAEDTVAYFNRLDRDKIFVRTRSVIGRKVQKCHPEHSVHAVQHIVDGFKDRTLDKADFWIDFKGTKVLIRYFPVYNEMNEYLGVLEVTQDVGWIQALTGQKRLLEPDT